MDLMNEDFMGTFPPPRFPYHRPLRVLSFDGGGVGVLSQLRLLEEIFKRYESETGAISLFSLPGSSFDLMEGSGIGGFAAACLGRLAMTTDQTMQEAIRIAPLLSSVDESQTPRQRSERLKAAVEDMLRRYGHSTDLPLLDKDKDRWEYCNVALLAVPKYNLSAPHVFRSYKTRGYQYNCTFVEAICATLAIPGLFEPVAIGPEGMKQEYISPLGFQNPTEETIKEAKNIYGPDREIELLLSLGSGRPAVLSLDAKSSEFRNPRSLSSRIVIDCEKVAFDVEKFIPSYAPYYRLNVDHGMENINIFDWTSPGKILTHTDTWIQKNTKLIDECVEALLGNGPTIRIGDLFGTPKKPPIPPTPSLFAPFMRVFSDRFRRNMEVLSY